MIAHKPPSASASPHPQGVQGKSARRGTTQAIQQQTGRRRTRASLAANALNNRGSEKQGLGVALARNPVGDGLENLSKPAAGTIQKIHYLTGGDGSLFAMYVIDQNNEGKMYYIYTDHTSTSLSTGLGSPNLITDAECNVVQELSYDACCVKLGFCEHSETKPLVEPIPSLREGNRRDPATWQPYTSLASIPSPLIDRGFTFHSLPREERNGEHLYPFTLINMNGRAYDPLVGRFLSADPYIQAPDNPQNLNRYSYCLNNPLRYTDPDGEWFWLIPMAAGFATGYISHGVKNGDWGWSAVGSGAFGAVVATIGFYSGGVTSAASIAEGFQSAGLGSHAATVALGFSGRYTASAIVSSVMPSISVPIGDNVCVNVSPGLGFGSKGISIGADISGVYNDGIINVSAGYGVTGNSRSWSLGVMHNGYGGSYYQTHYGNAIGPDGNRNNQIVGGVGLSFDDVSVRIENDFLAFQDPHDRWRSSAAAIRIGNFEIGTSLYNNDPEGEGQSIDPNGTDRMGNLNRHGNGSWNNGKVYNSPIWIGYKNGGSITRIGYSHPMVQDRTQNWVHRNGFFYLPIGHANYYTDYSQFTNGPHMYNGYYNPYSLW